MEGYNIIIQGRGRGNELLVLWMDSCYDIN